MPQSLTPRVLPVSFFARPGDDEPDLGIVWARENAYERHPLLAPPWVRINRVLCVMLEARWSVEAWRCGVRFGASGSANLTVTSFGACRGLG